MTLGTEPGKTRAVLILQTDLLNQTGHPPTLVLPLTNKILKRVSRLDPRTIMQKSPDELQAPHHLAP
ncbi:MAG: type II toxin-antitoxin system PemK/MazF family toxin [Candidatus Latescibacteria bacterium]|nr:type II toxin-antitoxin system PemK/MazF family toxin [Candidatus Latescibacterota bacterium]